MYNLPFLPNSRLIELGGGDKPLFRPNVDVRQCHDFHGNPTVDVIADLSEPLPLKSAEWDGVYCQYALEHVSWRKVRKFMAEVYRVLKPGGQAVFVTANLLEQARILTEEVFEDRWVGMIFGDNDYPENTHRCGFSPEFAGQLFREAGFERVIVIPHPNWRGDMIIEVRKADVKRKELFDRHYFNGGTKVGGYLGEGYRDYYKHWMTTQYVLNEKPESVLELGCGRGYVLKKLQDAGVPVGGLEISQHCYLTRVMNNVSTWDLCETPWPIPDQYFDLCFSMAVLEHVPEPFVAAVASEMARVSRRGLHGVDFGEQDNGTDKTHCTLRNQAWWASKLPTSQQVVNKDALEFPEVHCLDYDYVPIGDDKIKVNVGSFTNMFHHGWINLDVIDLKEFAHKNGYKFWQHDARTPLPFNDHAVDLLFSHHFLEHLTYDEGERFLREVYRVMKAGGTCRLVMPDAETLVTGYQQQNLAQFDEINDAAAATTSQAGKLWAILFAGHQAAYDWPTMKAMGERIGFRVERQRFREGHPQILRETLEMLPEMSLFVELVKQ